jgi:Delta14-sterol reductase
MRSILDSLTLHNLGIAAALFAGFVIFLFIGSMVLPGKTLEGVQLPDGTREKYRMNGLYLYLLTVAILAAAQYFKWFSLSVVVRYYWPLLAVANVFAFTLTGVHYVIGKRKGVPLEGNVILDAFMGTEVNPKWLGVDLKMFAYRPSLIGLGVINWSFAAAQYEALGTLTTRMMLYQVLYFLYLTNYFQFEYGMIYTWDIIAEKFGWMLIWGDYVLVPFFYSLSAWYLVGYTEPLPVWSVAAFSLLWLVGFTLFRGANQQKHEYKENPKTLIWGKPAEAIGGRLLVSGFWGIGRKLNYTGELMVYTAWTLTTGFQSIVPYILPLWLAGLFTHRAWRDEQRCSAKYGELWQAYRARAKFRMIPFLY